MRIEKPGSGA